MNRIERWKKRNINLDIEMLKKYGKDYVKIWISPFYDLYRINEFESGHKNPPAWFNRIILKAMTDIFMSWDEELKEIDQPYYLKIWLYDPNFINSQIVAAIGKENIEYYNSVFEKDKRVIKFPYNKYSSDDNNLSEFEWDLHKDQYIVYESEHDDEERVLNYIKQRAYKVEQEKILSNIETCYYIRQGNIWVGSLKK